jgi:hypothetical protein
MSSNKAEDTCGCCKGITVLTPKSLENLPGLLSLVYRVGTHGSFKTTMRAKLSSQKALKDLTTRDDDDPSIALIDAWACVLDVLTFYQERIANEGYLLTASERLSVLELARTIGYELKPGVAASTFLAFTLDNAPGTPGYATIDIGTKVMSIPGQDEKPQTFETIEKIEAKAVWNELKPRLTEPKIPDMGSTEVYLKGTTTGLKSGDGLLFVGEEREQEHGSERWDFRKVKTFNADLTAGYTHVTWEEGLGWERFNRKVLPAEKELKVYVFRLNASLFGYNAPDWRAMPHSIKKGYSTNPTTDTQWPNFTISSDDTIYLDSVYPGIVQDSWVLLSIPNYEEVYQVKEIEEASRSNYTLNSKTTRLKLEGENLKEKFDNKLRETAVFAQSEKLEITEAPRTDFLSGNVIELDSLVFGLEKGKLLIISGKRKTALVTPNAAGLELISEDGEKKVPLRPEDVLQVLEPPVQSGDKISWNLMDRNSFTGSVIAPAGSIQLKPAASDYPVISEVAVLEGIFENALPKRLKVVDYVFEGSVSKAEEKGLKGVRKGETFEAGYYKVVGWNGESYVALGGKINKIAKLVLEQNVDEQKKVNEGEAWGVGGGWILAVQKMTVATPKTRKGSKTKAKTLVKVQLQLIKDGIVKDQRALEEGDVYTYLEKSIAGETNVPLFVTYIDAIFAEAPVKQVKFKYTWAAGVDITEISIGAKFTEQDSIPGARERTILVLKEVMQNNYDPFTVSIYSNVANATHGETVHEVLGSGNGALANQSFTLKKQPVTYVSAPTPSGAESTIEVRVNDIKWQEVPSLYGLDERTRGYITRIDDNETSKLTFGDGKTGARLPTGHENVTATYRTGIGLQGMVKAGQLSLLMTRPLGVKGVINPLASTGAEDPEPRDQAKKNAPQKVLTLDRIVSLQDFEDFARAFSGIGKAQATWLWDGEVRFVHITVASANAEKVEETSETYKNLLLGIEKAKDPVQRFLVDSFDSFLFNLSAKVLVDSAYLKEKVLAAVTDALKQEFSFEKRSFGQGVTESEVLAVMQRVEGVKAVDLDALYMKGDPPDLKASLRASRAHQEKGGLFPAQLLTLNPEGIELKEMIL